MNTNKKIENPQNTRASAAQTTQYNGDGQDVSNSHKTPKKHESHKHVSKYNHKELQNTFQNCTH